MFGACGNGAVVVAHPDDEVLWAGGLLARYADRFTVICCSIPKSDPVRAWKFFDACDVLGVKARLLPFQETAPDQPLDHVGLLELREYDLIVTHNAAGEYGHHHHRALHAQLKSRGPVATFGYRPDGRGSILLHLSDGERAKKLAALRCYEHVSPHDNGKPKWQALLDRYRIDLHTESFDPPDA